MTKLSILVPHYNDPDGLALSLRSIEKQTWSGSREIVICDDGSRPELLEQLRSVCAETDEHVRLLRNRTNRGRPYTRNVLLDAADGKYCAWLDAGDEWYPDKLLRQFDGLYRARYLQFDHSLWCTCNYDWQWAGSRKRIRRQKVDGDQSTNMLLGSLGAYLWTLLGTTESFRSVGYFDLALTRLQDLDFFLRFLNKDGMLIMPPTEAPLCVYHKSDIGKNGAEVLRSFRRVLDKNSAVLMRHSRRYRRNRNFHVYFHAARFCRNNGELLRTTYYVGRSALYSPISLARNLIRNRGRL